MKLCYTCPVCLLIEQISVSKPWLFCSAQAEKKTKRIRNKINSNFFPNSCQHQHFYANLTILCVSHQWCDLYFIDYCTAIRDT
jgi:hypothetical protein